VKLATSIPGETYCVEHQGNHSHYAPHNCTVCVLLAALQEAQLALNNAPADAENLRVMGIVRAAIAKAVPPHFHAFDSATYLCACGKRYEQRDPVSASRGEIYGGDK
jgi:hypothetical protein